MSKVLIVDDDKNLLDVLRYNLVNDGFTVVTAEDGVQALETARLDAPYRPGLHGLLPALRTLRGCARGRPQRDQVLEVGRLYRPLYNSYCLGAGCFGLSGRQAVCAVNQKGEVYELAVPDTKNYRCCNGIEQMFIQHYKLIEY